MSAIVRHLESRFNIENIDDFSRTIDACNVKPGLKMEDDCTHTKSAWADSGYHDRWLPQRLMYYLLVVNTREATARAVCAQSELRPKPHKPHWPGPYQGFYPRSPGSSTGIRHPRNDRSGGREGCTTQPITCGGRTRSVEWANSTAGSAQLIISYDNIGPSHFLHRSYGSHW